MMDNKTVNRISTFIVCATGLSLITSLTSCGTMRSWMIAKKNYRHRLSLMTMSDGLDGWSDGGENATYVDLCHGLCSESFEQIGCAIFDLLSYPPFPSLLKQVQRLQQLLWPSIPFPVVHEVPFLSAIFALVSVDLVISALSISPTFIGPIFLLTLCPLFLSISFLFPSGAPIDRTGVVHAYPYYLIDCLSDFFYDHAIENADVRERDLFLSRGFDFFLFHAVC